MEKRNEINQQNSKSLYEIHKSYFLPTGMDSLAYVTTVFKSSMTDWQVINKWPAGKTYSYGHFNDIKIFMMIVVTE